MEDDKLFEACFKLAENLMWGKDTAPIKKQKYQLAELSMMTENFIRRAKENFTLIEDCPGSFEVMLGAISYLNAIAIPPLRGNYNWFDYSLSAYLDLCYPQGNSDKEGLPFFLKARNGIEQIIEWANNPDVEYEYVRHI